MRKHSKKIYDLWRSMIQRCSNKSNISYKYYGERGITVCDRWVKSIDNFIEDMGERPEGQTLDRIDSKGNYEPSNCKWSTIKEQNNNKSSIIMLSFNGETMNLSDWAKKLNTSPAALHYRIVKMKLPESVALTTPFTKKNCGHSLVFK